MKQKYTFLLLIFMTTSILIAEDLNINNLLNDISSKTDLSEKTKLENGGISYIYTREDIRRMQAHNLKDILKSTYPFGYNENNFGLSDPYAVQSPAPFMSSNLKIYIDNQELTTGLYGSGLILYGNMDIDFVDHIEIYSGNPTFEFSTEPAFTIIKLYSKSAKKDAGSKIAISGGSRGTKGMSAYNTAVLDNDWSYFVYGSLVDEKRQSYENNGAILSRDTNTKHLLAKFSKENQNFLIDLVQRDQDAFTASSIFATPKDASIKVNYAHIGYDAKYKNFNFLLSFDKYDSRTNSEDLNKQLLQSINALTHKNIPYSAKTNSTSEVYTAGLNYHLNFDSHKFLMGLKYRVKYFNYSKLEINGIELPRSGNDKQITKTAFIENYYTMAENKIITAGVSYSRVSNNHSIQDDNLLAYRLGYTYTNENFVSKTTVSHLEVTLDPYLINSIFLVNPTEKIDRTRQNIYMQNLKYKKSDNQYEMVMSYIDIHNQLMPDSITGLLAVYKKSFNMKSIVGRYTKEYNLYDKLEISLGYNKIKNLPTVPNLKQYAATLRNFNSFDAFSIFNEILYYRDDMEHKSYYDYSAGIIYHKTDDLSFSIKGTNIFNKARKSNYSRINPLTLRPDTPLQISPIDQKVMINMEYTF